MSISAVPIHVGERVAVDHPGQDPAPEVPTLRNGSETGPYFHDGVAPALPEAVRMMGRLPAAYTATPELPPSRESTARAEADPPTAATTTCGSPGEADCPTQRWMKATLQSHLRSSDYPRLASALDELSERAPVGYGGWAEISSRTADAARAGDEQGVRAGCKDCHEAHRSRFERELRQKQLF